MFSSKGKETTFVPANNGQAAAQPKRAGRAGVVPSIVSADLCVTGSLNTTGDMQIDGIVEGDVRTVGLVVGEKAEVHGEIWAEDLTVRGKVVGRIHARKVLLAATCHVEGDILHEAFEVEAGAFIGEKADIGWGHQIRSYVLQPYQLVKDLRTGVESRLPQDVLDGDIDPFMAAALAQAIGGKAKEAIKDLE
jgi:cytoskeletal protein CcmA (bactofilin family)